MSRFTFTAQMKVVAQGVGKHPASFPHASGPGYGKSGLVAALSSALLIGISRPKRVVKASRGVLG
jgi:hypothetical protein